LAIAGANPALLAKQDPAKVARANVAASKAGKPAMELITRHTINWTIVAFATPEWAKLVFPNDREDVAVAKLWEAIFVASRVDADDPMVEWQEHGARLKQRVDLLNAKRFSALHFKGTGTDLTVGLADDHLWAGGGTTAGNGVYCQPNIPTEECFTTPHKDRVNGTVRASKPLSHQGTLIENIAVRFEGGRIVEATATAGEDVLNRLISTDDGARRLGEVALVPHSSPIAQSGVLFWNTLFDENAASHIALGQAYSTCLIGGEKMDAEALAKLGANASLIHVDWMIGSGEMDVDGLAADGTSEPLMRKGEWA
jgi:aminopeptidase